MLKKTIQSLINKFGYQLSKLNSLPIQEVTSRDNSFTMLQALYNCQQRNIDIQTVIDVGASDGRWSADCLRYYPHANYLLIEAQQEHRAGLENFKKMCNKADYIIAAAGSRKGEIYFDNSGLFGGLASEEKLEGSCIVVPVTTIDDEVKQRKLPAPYLVKLDTHGFEVPILEGALETLKNANLVIIEVYNFQIAKDSLRFWEMCNYMEKLGFLPLDLVDAMQRAKDNAFWQMDIFFAKKDRIEFQHHSYNY
jgi:FkbM family methyltransferase